MKREEHKYVFAPKKALLVIILATREALAYAAETTTFGSPVRERCSHSSNDGTKYDENPERPQISRVGDLGGVFDEGKRRDGEGPHDYAEQNLSPKHHVGNAVQRTSAAPARNHLAAGSGEHNGPATKHEDEADDRENTPRIELTAQFAEVVPDGIAVG